MRLPNPVVIPHDKLTAYLLVERQHSDKSKYLAQAGFTQDNPKRLEQALRELVADSDATVDRRDEYGVFYRIEGLLIGPVGVLDVTTIWLERVIDGEVRFITLKPRR